MSRSVFPDLKRGSARNANATSKWPSALLSLHILLLLASIPIVYFQAHLKSTMATSNRTFHPFPNLPPELRTQIFHLAHALTPPVALPFHLLKSDLDYLRPLRKQCNNYPHIRCSALRVPPLLHACHESRVVALQYYTLGFDGGLGGRILKMGRGDADVETFTTCTHELAAEQRGWGVYWQRAKDIVLLEEGSEPRFGFDKGYAYIWGGATGIRFQRIQRIAISYETFLSLGLGSGVWWESIEELTLFDRGWWFGGWREQTMAREVGEVRRLLKNAGVRRNDGSEVHVRYVARIAKDSLMGWLKSQGIDDNVPHQDYGNENLLEVAEGGYWTG